jgi:hypothetical protein
MNIFPKHFVYLIAFCAVLAIAAFCADSSFPEKTSAASAPDSIALPAATTETVEETVTLSAANIKTWAHGYSWHEDHVYCGPSFHMEPGPEEIAGSMVVGYHHFWDEGAKIAGCPEAATLVTRGTVWFDLSSIASKAPPLHVSVTKALLHYKMDKGCDNHQLLIAQEDWLKGYPENKLVPGDPIADIPASCATEGKGPRTVGLVCAPEDVAKALNNWLRGEGSGGFANYGFAFAGTVEEDFLTAKLGHWLDNDACWTRFSDFSLTVTYKYDKTPPSSAPPAPRKNVALASNGAKATALSTMPGSFSPGTVIDGERRGINFLTGGGWIGAAPTNNDWLQVDFGGSKTINEIDVWMLRDDYTNPEVPGPALKFTKYGLIDFEVQYRSRFGEWVDVPGGKVIGNMNVLREFKFPELTTKQIRVLVSKTPDGHSRLTEVEAWSK